MCGIIGSLGDIDLNQFKDALLTLKHRGPDFQDIYNVKNDLITLGHSRLSIIDLSKNANQPMNFQNQFIITFNGEIYNYLELRSMLISKGISFKSNSDTEVLVAMFSVYGKEMLNYLDGIYAFAIWDIKSKKLFLARDYMGVKPLYYSHNNSNFLFASEIKAILKMTNQEYKANPISIFKHLSFMWSPSIETSFKNIFKLAPGEVIEINSNNRINKYLWNKKSSFNNSNNKFNENKKIAEVSYLIKKSVKKQLVSDVNLGILLSGGIDSSLITAFAKKDNPNIQSFTMYFPDGNEEEMIDDYKYAKLVSKKFSLKLNKIDFNYKNIEDDIKNIIYFLDEPIADLATLNLYYITKLANQMNHKVLLSGAGADDIFTGYRRHTALYIKEKLGLFHNLFLTSLYRTRPILKNFISKSSNRRISKLINIYNEKTDNNLSNYLLWDKSNTVKNLIHSDFKDQFDNNNIHEDFDNYLKDFPNDISEINKMLLLEQRFFLTEHNLNYVDKMSMANSIEVRVPYLDKDLVEYVNSLPESFKINLFKNKKMLKKISKQHLPKIVIKRKKAGFGSPVKKLIKGNLKEFVNDTFHSSDFLNRGLFNRKNVQNLINKNFDGPEDHSYSILSLLFIELWFRKFKVSL